VYKILQNSFYGMLGASGCRYARTELAGAITSFGQLFLRAARDWFEARGHEVLYGDTDSAFVRSGLGDEADHAALSGLGGELAAALNRHLAERIRGDHDVASHLAMRCEKVYRRFFIPRLRGDAGPDGRGRGKGYAGLLLLPGDATEVEVRGMGGGAERLHAAGPPLPSGAPAAPLRRRWGGRAPRIRPGDRGPAPPGRVRRRDRVPEGAPAFRGGARDADAAGPRGASPGLDGPPRPRGLREVE
jgi:hypothetical protein